MKYWIFVAVFIFLQNCQNKTSSDNAESVYPGIPEADMKLLIDSCDYIDYILYDYSFSISQSEKNQIIAALQHIGSPLTADADPNCKPVGRIFFQVKGENVAEADIYFGENCQYYVFLEGDQPKYANQLTATGIAFYNNIFKQFQEYKK